MTIKLITPNKQFIIEGLKDQLKSFKNRIPQIVNIIKRNIQINEAYEEEIKEVYLKIDAMEDAIKRLES